MKSSFWVVVLLSLGPVLAGCGKVASLRIEPIADQTSVDQKRISAEAMQKEIADLTNLAEQGQAAAQFGLGTVYELGLGVPKDADKAVEWYQKAAAQGDAKAQNNLGAMYDTGAIVPKDVAKAVEWYQKAAAQGNANAQFNLGAAHFKGQGVSKDNTKAVEWWQKAAAQGHIDAQLKLGAMYYAGEGVLKDWVLAYAWMELAVANSPSLNHRKARDIVGKDLAPEELAEAQFLSSNWKMGDALKRRGQ